MHRAATSLVPQQRLGPHARCRAAPRIGLGALLDRSRSTYGLRSITCSAVCRGLNTSSPSSSRLVPSVFGSNDISSSSSRTSSQPSQLQQLGSSSSSSSSTARRSIIAAGRPRKSEQQQPLDPDSPEALQKLTVAELRARCEEEQLDSSGKKAELVSRLVQHLQENGSSSLQDAAADAGQDAGDDDLAYDDADEAAGADDVSFEELLVELQAELQTYSQPELVKCLQDRGLSTAGAKKELVARLAAAVAEESGMAMDGPAEQQQQQEGFAAPASAAGGVAYAAEDFSAEPQQEQGGQQQQAAAPAGSSAAAERDWLVADKQQQLYDEMMGMGVKRQELLSLLAELGQSAAEDETADELAERASWLLAEEEVLLMEQQQAAAGGAAAGGAESLAASPSSILDSITATDVNKMKVDELKAYLRQLGLSDEGGRYVLRDRLMTMLVVRRAATAGDMDHLLQQLSQMTLSELRLQLESRGLDLSGSKAVLEMRLAQVLVVEIVGPEAAGAMGSLPGQQAAGAEEVGVSNPLLEDYDELLTAAVDPAATIALVCGTAPVLPGSSSSSSSTAERLQRVAAALATANTLIDELHTAPLDEDQAAAMAAGSSAADGEAAAAATVIPACGISVDIYWADDSGAFYQLPRTALAALGPADLLAQLPALATARYADSAALAKHLAATGATAALSALPGGALALSGKLSEACEAAGVALAGGAAFESDVGKQLARPGGPVLGRAAVLQELQALGYNTLPVLQLSGQELQGAAEQLRSWLEDIEADIAESIAADQAADSAAAAAAAAVEAEQEEEGDVEGEETGGGSGSSATLRSWNAGAAFQDAAGSVDDSAAAEEQREPEQQQQQKPQQPELVERLLAWCKANGMDADLQVFSVSGSEGGTPLGASRGHVALVSQLLDMLQETDAGVSGLLVEPLYRKLARWEVAVLSSAEDGPVALLPAELEQYSPLDELADADLALQEWQMMQAGMEEAQISQALEALAAAEPTILDHLVTPDLPDPLPHHTLKLHMPPRASNKIVQMIRHTAAKAVAQLGLEAAGIVRVSGWMALQPNWQQRYELPPEALQKVADYDAGQLARMAADEAAARASEPNPLCGYYDEDVHMADLAAFEPAARMHSEGNGEGDVMVADVRLDVPLAATSIAGLQALEVGLSPGGVARHLINLALLRQGKRDAQLLPPPAKPETAASAQWAQATGSNDSAAAITQQLTDAAVEAREESDNAALTADVQEDRAAFASMPFAEGVSEVLAALSKEWLTEEELAAPVEEPEEWTPEFDARTQEEIHAERDAGRPEEDLAARSMRDENMYHYGNQPIRYDRWDLGDDWVPPAIEAAAEGKRYPDVRELQAREDAKQQAKRDALLDRPYSEEDRLPEATEDEVLMGRILGHDRYKGGVTATLQRRERQGGDPSLSSAAAAAAAAGGPGSDAAAAAAAAAGGDAFARWPWPSEAEVAVEAALRRPAPRVWVLVGGDGSQRQRAFRSGANVAAKLARCCDIQVDVFLMPPAGSGAWEAKRRSTLLSRRTEWRALGIPEELYPASMTDDELISMPPTEVSVLFRQLIVAAPQHLARHTLEEAAEAAERCAARTGQSYIAAHVLDKQQRDSQFEAQMELDGHFVQGVGGAWGAQAGVLPPAPRFLDMQELLAEAKACDATLLLMLDDSTTANGQLQQILEGAGLPFTGMTSDFAFECSNRLTLNQAIGDIADSLAGPAAEADAAEGQDDDEAAAAAAAAQVGLVAVPRKVVKSKELLEYLDKPEEFEAMFAALLMDWDCSSVALKPPTRTGGLGVVRISNAEDLYTFADALHSCTPRLPAGTLQQQPLPVTLPLQLPELLLVEPWIETDAVAVVDGQAQWASKQRWVEVTVGLLGELGSMTALQPTLIAYSPEGSRQQFTPPPQHILPAAAVEAVQGFAVALADGLGLRSIAAVDGFVNVDTGELAVLDVQQLPDLSDGSPLLQQVLANDPPMLPYQLFRHLAQQAYISQQLAQEAAAAGGSIGSSAYYAAPDEEGGFGAEDFDLGQPAEQGLAGDLFEGVEGDVVDDAAVDDEEMQGMSAGWTRE